jgi:hypothetical protein
MKAIKLLSVLFLTAAISLGVSAQTSKTTKTDSKQSSKTTSTKTTGTKPAAKTTSAKSDSKSKTASTPKKK